MSKGKLFVACFIWLMILGFGVLSWKLVFVPEIEDQQQQQIAQEQAEAEKVKQQRIESAGSPSRYKHSVDFYLDSFSGYAVLRSDEFQKQLKTKAIRIDLHDDGADYGARLKALQTGDAQMAVFTIDALIKSSATAGELPATIVAIVDETMGADAIVAYKEQIPNVDSLNQPETKFVLTPDSPSETLARVVMSRFNLADLTENPFVTANDAADVYKRYSSSKPTDQQVYVLWEPYVSKMMTNPAMHVVVDSSRFPSTIVDVIVASRDFLLKQPDVVRDVIECYMRSVYAYRERSAMLQLVISDAKATGSPLTSEQAEKLVDGIWWKNTQENLAHMGFLADKPLPHLEDIISNVTDVLEQTGAIQEDPTGERANYLYHAKVFEQLKDFHPGQTAESIRDMRLPALSDAQWQQLSGVGTAKVPPLVFARGTDRLTSRAKSVLDELAENLKTTRFYVSIVGSASKRGNLEQNKLLAEKRAKVAEQYLIEKGIDRSRIRAVGSEPSGTTSVTFMLGQLPY